MVYNRIDVPIFNAVLVMFKGTPKSLKKKIDEWFDNENEKNGFKEVYESFKSSYDSNDVSAWTTYYNGIAYCLFPSNSDDLTYSTLIHELSHAVTFILEDRQINDNTDECRSYLLGYLFENTSKFRKDGKFIDK